MTQTQQSTADWQALDSAHFLHPFTNHKQMHAKGVRIIEKADGVYLWDSDGNKILDAMAGLWCVNVGYGLSLIHTPSPRDQRGSRMPSPA